jgi:hexulose-6-phosphate isomerase
MLVKAINVWSYPGGLEGTLDPGEALRLAKRQGFEGVELCVAAEGPLSLGTSEAECRAIAREAESLGLKLGSVASGTYWGRALGDADPAAREGARDDLERMIRLASWLGARTLLTIPGAVDVFFLPDRPAQPYDEVLRNASEGLRAVLPTAEAHGVRLGIENVWNRFLLSPTEMAAFLDGFGSPFLGAYLDVANVLPFGYPEQWLRILGPRVVGVHFKDYRRAVGTAEGFVDLLEGDVNWPEVVRALEEIGYDGPVAAEMIPLYRHHPLVRSENASRAMDAILGR